MCQGAIKGDVTLNNGVITKWPFSLNVMFMVFYAEIMKQGWREGVDENEQRWALWEVKGEGAWSEGEMTGGGGIRLRRGENGLEWMKVRRRGRRRGWWEGGKKREALSEEDDIKAGVICWMGRGAAGARGGDTAERCELMEELDSATCLPLPPHVHFPLLFPPHLPLLLVFSPFHPSLLLPPPSSHRRASPLMPACR